MCLHQVTQEYNKTSMKIHVGYKVFKVREYPIGEGQYKEGLFFPYFHHHFKGCRYNADYQVPVKPGVWMIAQKSTTYTQEEGRPYETGFSICLNKYDAKLWAETHCHYQEYKIVKVLFRNVALKGEDECGRLKVVIAREILVKGAVKIRREA